MNPKYKAGELLWKFLGVDDNQDLFCHECGMNDKAAKLCALIAVDEILKAIPNYEDIEYWHAVKQELLKL